jgi:hypothetical protein
MDRPKLPVNDNKKKAAKGATKQRNDIFTAENLAKRAATETKELEKKKAISASDSAEILKGEEIFSDIVSLNSSVTGHSFYPSDYYRCHDIGGPPVIWTSPMRSLPCRK